MENLGLNIVLVPNQNDTFEKALAGYKKMCFLIGM
jgi:hypothetical protein